MTPNPLETAYRNTKIETIKNAEGMYLAGESKTDILLAVCAVLFEGVLGFCLSLPAGLPIAIGTGMIPIVSGLVLAKYQSDHFDVPEAAEKLLASYTQSTPENITEIEAMEIDMLDARKDFVSGESPVGITSKTQASGKVKVETSQLVMKKIDSKGIETITQLQKDRENAIAKLRDEVPQPTLNVQGMTPEQEQSAVEDWQSNWILAEEAELERIYQQKLVTAKAEFGAAIAYWEVIQNQGNQDLNS